MSGHNNLADTFLTEERFAYRNQSLIIEGFAELDDGDEEPEPEQSDGSQRTYVDRMSRDMVDARTPEEILTAINDVNSHQEAIAAAQPENVDVGALSQLQQLIVQPGECGGVLTRTEFTLSKFCTEEKLKKKTSYHLFAMLKSRDL